MFPFLLGLALLPQSPQLQTDSFTATVSPTGHFTAFVDRGSGRDYLPEGQTAPLLRLRVAGEYREPEALSADGDRWTLDFGGGYAVALRAEAEPSHLRFEVLEARPLADIELLMWGPYPTAIGETIGETVGVVRDGDYAIGIQALNAKTLGGAATTEDDVMPSYNIFKQGDYSDVGEDVKVLYRGDTAVATDFGSTLQAYTRDRSGDRVIANWGHERYLAPAFDDGGVVGSAIALFGCPASEALATLGAIELAEGLPHPMIDGEWAKTARGATASYLIIGFGEDSIDAAIELTERAGLRYLYHGGPFQTWGHFELNARQFPNGWDGLEACVDRARGRGIGVGVHTLSNFITTNDRYVTPVPDPRLAAVGASALARAVDAGAESLAVADPGWFSQMKNNTLRTVRVGDELIQYAAVEGNELVRCTRGAFGTAASAHAEGAVVTKLMDHGYRTFLTDPGLSREVAERIAALYNHTGLRQLSFDGLEGTWATGMGQYGRTLFTEWWFEALRPELRGGVINDASNPGHYNWHTYTRMNWGEPWYAGFRESQTQYRLMNQRYYARNLMPRMLGWFKMGTATTLEDAEWLLARAAGFDAGFAFVTGPDVVAGNGQGDAILAAIREWETARLAGAFPERLKPALQDIGREFHLEPDGDGAWRLTPVYSFKGVHERQEQPGMATATAFEIDNPHAEQPLGFILRCTGAVAAEESVLELNGRELALPGSLEPGQVLRHGGGGELVRTDADGRVLERFQVDPAKLSVPRGRSSVRLTCRFAGSDAPAVKVEFRTSGPADRIGG